MILALHIESRFIFDVYMLNKQNYVQVSATLIFSLLMLLRFLNVFILTGNAHVVLLEMCTRTLTCEAFAFGIGCS